MQSLKGLVIVKQNTISNEVLHIREDREDKRCHFKHNSKQNQVKKRWMQTNSQKSEFPEVKGKFYNQG